jgi:hypothetical protein
MMIFAALNFVIREFPANYTFASSTHAPSVKAKSHNLRLSSIKFGDLTDEDKVAQSPYEDKDPSEVVTRVLLDLPFELLKYLLEAPSLGSREEDAPFETLVAKRFTLMEAVVEARQKRRVAERAGIVAKRVDGEERLKLWQKVGNNEAVQIDGARKIPVLVRTWVDLPQS